MRYLYSTLALLSLLLLLDHRGLAAPVAFADPISILSDGGTGDSTAGDLDGDGRAEFVVSRGLRILDWDGTEWDSYGPIVDTGNKLDRFAGGIDLADIDGDGDLDIVTTDSSNAGSTGSLVWYENPGSLAGAWQEHLEDTWDGSGNGNSITHADLRCGDLNGDGRQDIVVRDIASGSWVFLQKTDGTGFEQRIYLAHNPREGIALSDIDRDGDLDIWINGAWWETPADPLRGTYILHQPIGMNPNWYPPGNSTGEIHQWACKVAPGDFNGDGRPDVAISNAEELSSESAVKPEGIRIYLAPENPIEGTWTEVVVRSDRFSWHTLHAADFNADGRTDLIASISDVGVDEDTNFETTVFLNDGSGTGFTSQQIQTQHPGYQGALGDSDGDGDLDLLLPYGFNSGPVRYFQNIGTATAGTLDAWLRQYFTMAQLENPAIGDRMADPDGDGFPNLREWAHGLDPWLPDTRNAVVSGIETASDGLSYLTIRFLRRLNAANLEISIDVASDLTSWSPGAGILSGTPVDNQDGTETVTYRDVLPATSSNSPRFIRLQIKEGK